MSENKERTNALLELLGKVRGNKTLDGLKAAAERLDKAGVQRKSIDPDALAAKIVTAAKDAGKDANLIDVVRDELEAALADVSAGEPAAEADEEIEEIEDGDEEPEGATDGDPVKTILKAMTDQGDTIRQDVGEIAKAQLAQAGQLGDVVKVLAALDERIKAAEEQLDGRPRIASKAKETEIENDGGDAFKELLQKMEKGVNGDQTFQGFKVSEQPK